MLCNNDSDIDELCSCDRSDEVTHAPDTRGQLIDVLL